MLTFIYIEKKKVVKLETFGDKTRKTMLIL